MQRFKVIKIVYAKNLAAAMREEKKATPVEISLDEEVGDPTFKEKVIGFHNEKDGGK